MQLQGAGGAQHRPLGEVEHPAGLEGEERPQPLAGAERRVAHGLGQAGLRAVGARQQLVERDRDQIGRLGHAAVERIVRSRRTRRLDARGAGRADDDLLDPQLGLLELGFAVGLQGRAALIDLDRALELGLARFELGDDPLQLGEGLLRRRAGRCLRLRP